MVRRSTVLQAGVPAFEVMDSVALSEIQMNPPPAPVVTPAAPAAAPSTVGVGGKPAGREAEAGEQIEAKTSTKAEAKARKRKKARARAKNKKASAAAAAPQEPVAAVVSSALHCQHCDRVIEAGEEFSRLDFR